MAPPPPPEPRGLLLVYAKLVAVAAMWGGTFIAGRVAASTMAPEAAALGRFVIATLGLVAVAWGLEGGLPRLDRRQLITTLLMGLSGIFAYNVLFFKALSEVPAGRTSLFVSLNPVVTLAAGMLVLGERLAPVQLVGMALAFCGVAIVIARGDLSSLAAGDAVGTGEVAMMGAVVSWAAYTIIGRTAMRSLSPIAATTYSAIWGTALLALHAAWSRPEVTMTAIRGPAGLAVVYMGLIGTVVAFIWFAEGVRAVGAARAAVFTNLVPVFAVVQAAVLLDEPVLMSMVIGGAIAIAGVTLTNRAGS